ncbi:nitrate assimilation regulatory protein nirA [Pochonia chlamydosporia 170]|uniref:Nitrate assimilation regulatory protein nirA n=1 Tax=Pochonia chlamydosporia 170 TaxID=1380566 RepID=A0A179FYE1_METCM|nr:nitrate assimilation regulatory protein nirA [Pochonia chlamydosporia 170]OAQ69979.1 nitrate assimilation regulatory protein nirA [Pochonia chlamydosporia 170]
MSRPLLPRPTGEPSRLQPPKPLEAARKAVTAACEHCRKAKQKCSGERPRCYACVRRGGDCVYRMRITKTRARTIEQEYEGLKNEHIRLQETHADLEKLVQAMRAQDDGQANTIFRKIREGASTESILRLISTGDALVELRLPTDTKYRFDFPYKKEMPSTIKLSNSPYLRSLMHGAIYATSDATSNRATVDSQLWDQYKPQYLKPYQAARIVDPRFESVMPSNWTHVSSDNELMRRLLHAYFLFEYPWYSFFHKDHFLDDMVSGSRQHCSSLLVNVILTLACGCSQFVDRSEYWKPQSLGYKFFAEAKRLWELEQNQGSRLTTIQSAALMNIVYNMQSMDKLGMTYTVQAIAMAQDLGIFNAPDPSFSKRKQVSYGFTAWSLFNWTSLQQYHFMMSPIIREAPRTSLPDIELEPSWYGDFDLLYPTSQGYCPTNFGHLFKAKSHLAVILKHIATRLWDTEERERQLTSVSIREISAELDLWVKALPTCLSPMEIVFPAQIKLHLLFHNVVINLHELVTGKSSCLVTESDWNMARLALETSRTNFEALMRLYYLRHGYETSDTYLTHTLAVMAFMSLGQLSSAVASTDSVSLNDIEDLRSTVYLAAKGLVDQGKNYYIPYTLFEVIKRQLSPDDVNKLLGFLDVRESGYGSSRLRTEHIQAQYPVNILDMADHPDKKRLGNMIREFADMALEVQSPGATSNPAEV